ncbi:ATP-binding protein [Rhizobium phaseoli]|uniref:histidine kinase n=1 Tax=Rhizobium phaseoli TaxID=396 RepID=A0ABN4QUQ8_9HYPH|nr:ATP-binding protein [Rhizobium phaseoli]KEC69722.1 sensory histidine kinase QseC [Rhizobium leguminosarum bv. phaseoli CCGM1]ANL57293.1 sensor histidine kinase protein [Rhizobium phaseoli]ANL89191.1 sensor histidine kinase protein [Rhizobium phaseoli]ANL95700.1 sensor histidine kinase protein [Rhizobium phaseoli]PWI50974.1 two-component sensor histidine kinase [Rhizobium phaseoli]
MRKSTLTRKLFLRIAPVVLVTILVIGAFAFNSATREINNIYDAQLINDANVLWGLLHNRLRHSPEGTPQQIDDIDFSMDNQLAFNEDADDYADAHMFRAWVNGKIMFYSSTAFLSDVPYQKAGFTDLSYRGENWRVYSLPIPASGIVMEVGEKTSLRYTLVSNILLNLVFPLLVLVPVIGCLIWLGINNGLRTIYGLVHQIRTRSPDDLSAIAVEGLPRDLLPLGRSINQLLEKLGRSLTLERRFSDLAAHQLRTPQASVKLLLQMLASTDDQQEQKAIISDLVTSNNRATHLIEQLLRLARVSHHPLNPMPVPLYHMIASTVADFGNIINSRNLDVSLEGPESAEIRTDESLLQMMVSNLLDNAIKYTPVGGIIEVILSSQGEFWLVSISDSGPGIAPVDREAVFKRFYRLDTLHAEGAGLGLAIVADTAERLSVSIALSTPPWGNGLRVELRLPRD